MSEGQASAGRRVRAEGGSVYTRGGGRFEGTVGTIA
jgi:hypothetical protein